MVYATLIGALGYVITYVLPILLLTGNETSGIYFTFFFAMIIVGIAYTLVLVLSSYYLKEYKFAQLDEPMGMFKALKECVKNRPFIIFEMSLFSIIIAQTILTTAIFYYVDYVLNLSGFLAILPIVIVIGMIFAFAYIASRLI